MLVGEVRRARQDSVELWAGLESLRADRRATKARVASQAERVGLLEGQVTRLASGVEDPARDVTRAWIRRLESRVAENERRFSVLERRLDEGLGGVEDTLKVSRASSERSSVESLAAGEPGQSAGVE